MPMSSLYVVRHGQAGPAPDDYDRLSGLGRQQVRALGEQWRRRGLVFEAAWSGELRRQVDTAEEVAAAMRESGAGFPDCERLGAFDEYPADTILKSLGEHLRASDSAVRRLWLSFDAAASGAERSRAFQRLLEAVIGRWVAADHAGFEPPVTWREWSDEVRDGLRAVLSSAGRGTNTALFTSGGVMAVTVQTVLEAPPAKAAELNWRVYNAAVTRYAFSGARITLDCFNDVSHLSPAQLTYR